jgi:hypothetical protein
MNEAAGAAGATRESIWQGNCDAANQTSRSKIAALSYHFFD